MEETYLVYFIEQNPFLYTFTKLKKKNYKTSFNVTN